MKKPRFILSLNSEAEELVKHIQQRMQEQMPKHLSGVKVSKCLAVETALKEYVKQLEAVDEQF